MLELWIHPEKRRYYKFAIYRDLLGDRVLLRSWGSLDSKLSGCMTQVISSEEEEQPLIDLIRKRRQIHCYELVDNN